MSKYAKSLRGAALLASLARSIGALPGAGNSPGPGPASPDRYIAAVRTFADHVLALGTDHYGPAPTPLFVDGVDVDTHEPVKWNSRDGHEWVLSDFANQQNLLRTLDGLTALTGEPRYRAAGAAATRYAFDHLDRGGLLAWGGHMAYNARDARIEFVARDRQFASFDRVQPLTLLPLAATIEGRPQAVPAYPGGAGFYSADYGTKLNQYDSFIYALPRRTKPAAPDRLRFRSEKDCGGRQFSDPMIRNTYHW
jgi:hypothetical protein